MSNNIDSAARNAPPAPPPPAGNARLQAMLHGPILPTLLRMAWPNLLMMLAQSSTGLVETWYLSAWAPTRWPALRWSRPC